MALKTPLLFTVDAEFSAVKCALREVHGWKRTVYRFYVYLVHSTGGLPGGLLTTLATRTAPAFGKRRDASYSVTIPSCVRFGATIWSPLPKPISNPPFQTLPILFFFWTSSFLLLFYVLWTKCVDMPSLVAQQNLVVWRHEKYLWESIQRYKIKKKRRKKVFDNLNVVAKLQRKSLHCAITENWNRIKKNTNLPQNCSVRYQEKLLCPGVDGLTPSLSWRRPIRSPLGLGVVGIQFAKRPLDGAVVPKLKPTEKRKKT